MGIPNFYRWLSQKYPQCFQHVNESRVRNFVNTIDNLYLDMNGIIHSSCQAKLNDQKTKFSEENVFRAISSYISYLVKRIQPRRLLFIAIDGVSPRAKLNQQRSRRFINVQSTSKTSKRAKAFDTNSITPGTEFMTKFSSYLEYFIRKQVSEDANWHGIQVVLSSHETPGEGEHKILEHLRCARLLPDYNPKLRHCLYGSDSDLVVLGLLSHEANFVVMREKLTSNRNGPKNRSQSSNPQNFTLIRLSTLRKYFDQEFSLLQELDHFEYNLEKTIDDIVLLTFFVGNDFLPRLPFLNMVQHPLELVLNTYKSLVQNSEIDGYINNNGIVDLSRLKVLIDRLCGYEREVYQQHFASATWYQQEYPESTQSSASKSQLLTDKYIQWKSYYYQTKLETEFSDKPSINEIAKCYIEGIQWLLHYYYHGVLSWSWFYPYHYAPMATDLREFPPSTTEFELGAPFRPLELLMSVLPTSSSDLIPLGYRDLMLDPASPIIDFYPKKYSIDMEGKNGIWEAVVQIPFIDEDRLLKALETREDRLTQSEHERNNSGDAKSFTHCRQLSLLYSSPFPGSFPDIIACSCRMTKYTPSLPTDLANLQCDEKDQLNKSFEALIIQP
ncbi:exonuclease II Exo2 [Basidiobolus ranarum]|uniref:Exonuclease II Exo2 n=1 Tax=Basidiobolus ranarum TaxID=34480 RepID=A0ABR2VYQ1_9FUNG